MPATFLSKFLIIKLYELLLRPLSVCSKKLHDHGSLSVVPHQSIKTGKPIPETAIFSQKNNLSHSVDHSKDRMGTIIKLQSPPRHGYIDDNFMSLKRDDAPSGFFSRILAARRLDVIPPARLEFYDDVSTTMPGGI